MGTLSSIGLWLCTLSTTAHAQATSFSGPSFLPAPDRSTDYVTAHSAKLLPQHAWSAADLMDYAHDPLVVEDLSAQMPAYAGPYSGRVVQHRVVARALGAYALMPWLQVAADVPVVLTQNGDDRTGLPDPGQVSTSAGLGDLRLLGKLRLYDSHRTSTQDNLRIALVADVAFPTGDAARYQGGVTRLSPVAVAEWSSSFGARIAGNLGYAWRSKQERFADEVVNSGFVWAAALELPLWPQHVSLLGEAAGDMYRALMIGLRGRLAGVTMSAVAGPGLSNTTLTPDYRVALDVSYRGGTAEPQDADNDGVLDGVDSCPNEPEDIDNYQDADGCPDVDNDGDGILDIHDRCPQDAEDIDRYEDEDGCPDADNDGDGIVDIHDRCIMEMEDADGFEDGDGCPDLDNDGDGIADAQDACPLDAEDADGDHDDDGCPDIEASVRVDVVLFFERDSSDLSPEAMVQLDRVAHTLIAMPDELHVWISGHADDTGKPEYNEKLGMKRAEVVRQVLMEHGVAAERMSAQSYGDTKNEFVAEGEQDRLANRHVEFRVGPRSLSGHAEPNSAPKESE